MTTDRGTRDGVTPGTPPGRPPHGAHGDQRGRYRCRSQAWC